MSESAKGTAADRRTDGTVGLASPENSLIHFDHVSLAYPQKSLSHHTLKDAMLHPFSVFTGAAARRPVLQDIEFTLKRGDKIGILGINGSGKSTLLKLMARIFPPTSGTIYVNGRVLPLISFNAGFHPDMTGVENVLLASLLHGRRPKATQEAMDNIMAFAEIGDHFDSPVRTYSDGMRNRLAFAIAQSLPFDVLLIDEVLAVGDGKFQKKCQNWIQGLDWTRKALVFVSHALDVMNELTTEAIWVSEGKFTSRGQTRGVTYTYRKWLGVS